MPKIYLYAEVLTHLRQLTLHASLETEKNEDTKIEISSNKRVITVIHDGESSSLYLPTQISGTAQVTFPYDKKTELSARVQIEDLEQWQETDAAGIEAPWNASELSFETSMKCRECDCELLSMGTVSSWKDLPNQNWADVMDLWFCHKPHEHHDEQHEQQAAEAKGFSAQSKLASKPGVGMVNLVSFVLHPDDCSNIQIARINDENTLKLTSVQCAQCQIQVGSFSQNENLIRLYKACVNVRTTRKEDFVSFPITTFISAELLELIESTAIRKVIAYYMPADTIATTARDKSDTSVNSRETHQESAHEMSESQASENLKTESRSTDESTPLTDKPLQLQSQPCLLWIFNPDIYYSSSRLTTETKTNTTMNSLQNLSVSPTSADATASPSTTATTSNPFQPASTSTTEPDQPTTFSTQITLPHRALKIFYRNLTSSEISTLLPSLPTTTTTATTSNSTPTVATTSTSIPPPSPSPLTPNTIEYLPITNPTHLHALHTTLKLSTAMLPQSARSFQDFSVGLLDRYERHPTAEKVMENNPLARKLDGDGGENLGMDGRPRVTRWEMPAGAHELYL